MATIYNKQATHAKYLSSSHWDGEEDLELTDLETDRELGLTLRL